MCCNVLSQLKFKNYKYNTHYLWARNSQKYLIFCLDGWGFSSNEPFINHICMKVKRQDGQLLRNEGMHQVYQVRLVSCKTHTIPLRWNPKFQRWLQSYTNLPFDPVLLSGPSCDRTKCGPLALSASNTSMLAPSAGTDLGPGLWRGVRLRDFRGTSVLSL